MPNLRFYKDPVKHREYMLKYYKTWYAKNGRRRAVDYQEAIEEWRLRNPEKIRAKETVSRAIRKGKLIKPNRCTRCERKVRLSGHHNDYTKPLEVLWLCGSCHKLEHRSKHY